MTTEYGSGDRSINVGFESGWRRPRGRSVGQVTAARVFRCEDTALLHIVRWNICGRTCVTISGHSLVTKRDQTAGKGVWKMGRTMGLGFTRLISFQVGTEVQN
ncbi:hypothetical protein SLEP1_g37286 [Rubroshorea leprosula]|uniref:Uncharacterized protein n=1 Tax=Rubroshorea leprosula TaxID=152421 RepID=A0AAV5KUE6_9ROSI|nr:hypothetical protein SLEP1_g37286 [Rubroshorea leprosula]